MNRGLTTLMTVAIALVSVQAMAVAPTIGDIPSPIIGNQVSSTQATKYVYADAFDLTKLADDNLNNPATDPSLLKWSYEIVGTPKYGINGLPSVNSSIDDVVNPPDTKNINKTLDTSKETKDGDGKPNTVTIRNINLAPYSGTGNTPSGPGFIDQQLVTFYVSNGAAVSSQTINFYTDNTNTNGTPSGWNRLSQTQVQWKMEAQDGMSKSWMPQTDLLGSVTTNTWGTTGKGLCFNVPKLGNNMWSMQSKYAFFTMTANNVYRIRATMNCSQATVGKTPFWDFIVENYGSQNGVTKGLNLYGMDAFYLDNEGGANSVVNTQAGTEFKIVWAPIAFRTAQWNDATNGLYATKYAADKDPYLRFRILDAVANPGLMSDQKFGQLCLQQVIVESVPYSRFVEDATLYNVTAPKAANSSNTSGNMYAAGLIGTSISYPTVGSGTQLQIQPGTNAYTAELVTVYPAVDLNGIGGTNVAPPYTQIADDWPIPWQSDKILKMEVNMYAPSSNDQLHPFDVIWLSMEPPTNEIDAESFVTANKGIGSPKYDSANKGQTYTFFYYTANETKSAVSQLHFLRWRVRFGNSASLNFPQTSDVNNNSGVVRISSVKIAQVHVQ